MDFVGFSTDTPRSHPEGYSVNVWRGQTRLATVYGGDLREVRVRAAVVARAFQEAANATT